MHQTSPDTSQSIGQLPLWDRPILYFPSVNLLHRAFVYKLEPTKEQDQRLERTRRTCCMLYNLAVEQRRFVLRYRPSVKMPNWYAQKRELKELRPAGAHLGLMDVPHCVLGNVLQHVDRAFERWMKPDVSGRRAGFPHFHKHDQFRSWTYPALNNGVSLRDHPARQGDTVLRLFAIGDVRVRWHRPLQGHIKTITIIKEADGWYVSFSCADVPSQPLPTTGNETGIDLGLESFLTCADGTQVGNPRLLREAEQYLVRMQRSVSRKKKGSNQRKRAVDLLAKAHLKVRRARQHFHRQVAHDLTQHYDTIYHEDLRVANMVKNHHLAKSISDAGWSAFIQTLTSTAENTGREVIGVPPAYTSQLCSECGVIVLKTLATRWHTCPACGASLHRDHNAAINILQRGKVQSQSLTVQSRKLVAS